MLVHSKELEGFEVHARDGGIGRVADLYFDDEQWVVRYFVVNTGSWLHRHQVLLAAAGLERDAVSPRTFRVAATMEQVRHSPEIDTVRTASREQERALHDYYGWPYYWAATPAPSGLYGISPPITPLPPPEPAPRADAAEEPTATETDSHFWSMHEIRGYGIHARDGHVGHLEEFLLEETGWSVAFLVVDTRNVLPGKRVLLPPRQVQRLSWPERGLFIDRSCEEIRNLPEFDPDKPVVQDYTDRPLGHDRPLHVKTRE